MTLALAAASIAWAVNERASLALPPAGPSYPEAWDARVAPLVDFVEEQRQLFFEHPVFVDFLPDDEFVADLTRQETDADAEVTEGDDPSDAHTVEVLRALSVVHGELDLTEAGEATAEGSVVGFYSYEDQRIRVRGTDLDGLEVRTTLVHELTHALQDQHFDLAALHEDVATSGEASGLLALIEGDASVVEGAYHDNQLGDGTGSVVDPAADDEGADDGLGSVSGSPTYDLFIQAPYSFGYALAATLEANGGAPALDEAYANPPTSDEQLLFPDLYRRGVQPVAVPLPALGPGEQAVALYEPDDPLAQSTDIGALTWFAAVVGRLDHHVAWEVAGPGRVTPPSPTPSRDAPAHEPPSRPTPRSSSRHDRDLPGVDRCRARDERHRRERRLPRDDHELRPRSRGTSRAPRLRRVARRPGHHEPGLPVGIRRGRPTGLPPLPGRPGRGHLQRGPDGRHERRRQAGRRGHRHAVGGVRRSALIAHWIGGASCGGGP